MGKIYVMFVALLCVTFTSAQVGVGTTTPDGSAELDVTSTNRGFLMPRVALTSTADTATITGAEATSLLVYNTATAGDVTPGFYYWDGTQWVTLGGTAAAAWELLGNAGTNPATNFVGTTDGQDLVFRTNNTERFRIDNGDQVYAGGTGGVEALPFYSFNGDTNTGIWTDGGDEFSLGAGSQEFITIDEGATEGDVIIFNEDSDDMNFRVETNNNNALFAVDGGDDQVRINQNAGFFADVHGQSITDDADDAFHASTSGGGYGLYSQSTGTAIASMLSISASASTSMYAFTTAASTGVPLYAQTANFAPAIIGDNDGLANNDDAVIGFGSNTEGFGGGWFTNAATTDATSFGTAENSYGVLGMKLGVADFSSGVMGNVSASGGNGRSSAGVLGTNVTGTTQNAAGTLGYRPSTGGTYYGGYFIDNNGGVDHTDGAGFTSGNGNPTESAGFRSATTSNIKTNVGFGAIGGLMGGWAKGAVYGFTTQGTRYSLYVDGREFTNDVITQLSDNNGNDRIATYVPTSTTVDVSAKGMSSLQSGQRRVSFDKNFSSVISKEDPVIVTVTPIGESNGIHLASVDATGFTIKENAGGASNVQFTWIAIGTKKGYEAVKNPEELMAADYDKKLDEFMIDESSPNQDAQEMWWDGTQIRYSGTPNPSEYGFAKAKEKKMKNNPREGKASNGERTATAGLDFKPREQKKVEIIDEPDGSAGEEE